MQMCACLTFVYRRVASYATKWRLAFPAELWGEEFFVQTSTTRSCTAVVGVVHQVRPKLFAWICQ